MTVAIIAISFFVERRWKHADDNADGLLSKVEFRAFLHPEEDPSKSDIVVTEAIDMMDSDDDQVRRQPFRILSCYEMLVL